MSMPSSAAVHTRNPNLHAAAGTDFEQHVRLLLATGGKNEAEGLWESALEVHHLPAPRAPSLAGTGLPPMAAMACTVLLMKRDLRFG